MFGTAGGKEDNDFVGQLVEVGSQRLRIKKVIAEGERIIKFNRNVYSHLFKSRKRPLK